jgi:hypothetical protein
MCLNYVSPGSSEPSCSTSKSRYVDWRRCFDRFIIRFTFFVLKLIQMQSKASDLIVFVSKLVSVIFI